MAEVTTVLGPVPAVELGGWTDRLLVSSDRCLRSDLTAFGGLGYAHVLTGFGADLLAAGLTAEEFDQITVTNPARVLAR